MARARAFGLNDHPAPVQVEHAGHRVVEQLSERRPQGLGADQRLAHPDGLPDVRQKTLDHLDLLGAPAVRFGRVRERPDDVQPIRPVHADVQAVAGVAPAQQFVVRRRGRQFRFGKQVSDVHHASVGQAEHARNAFVAGKVVST